MFTSVEIGKKKINECKKCWYGSVFWLIYCVFYKWTNVMGHADVKNYAVVVMTSLWCHSVCIFWSHFLIIRPKWLKSESIFCGKKSLPGHINIRLYYFRVSLLFEVVNGFSALQGPPAVPSRSSDHVISLLDKYFTGLHFTACQVCRHHHSSTVCSWGGRSPDVTFHKRGEQMSKIEMEGDKDSEPGGKKSKRWGRWEEGEKKWM